MRHLADAAVACWLVAVPYVVLADRAAGEKKADLCLLCHRAVKGEFVPLLDGQPKAYLLAQMVAYKTGKRIGGGMVTNVAGLSPSDMQDLADFFASRSSGPYPIFDSERATSGIRTLTQLSCSSCHGSDYSGNGAVARLSGQNPKYTGWQLRLIRSGSRLHPTSDGGESAKALAEDDIDNIAHAFGSMK